MGRAGVGSDSSFFDPPLTRFEWKCLRDVKIKSIQHFAVPRSLVALADDLKRFEGKKITNPSAAFWCWLDHCFGGEGEKLWPPPEEQTPESKNLITHCRKKSSRQSSVCRGLTARVSATLWWHVVEP